MTQLNAFEMVVDAKQLHELRVTLKKSYYVTNANDLKIVSVKKGVICKFDSFWVTILYKNNTTLAGFLMDAGKLSDSHNEKLASMNYYKNTKFGKCKIGLNLFTGK